MLNVFMGVSLQWGAGLTSSMSKRIDMRSIPPKAIWWASKYTPLERGADHRLIRQLGRGGSLDTKHNVPAISPYA